MYSRLVVRSFNSNFKLIMLRQILLHKTLINISCVDGDPKMNLEYDFPIVLCE